MIILKIAGKSILVLVGLLLFYALLTLLGTLIPVNTEYRKSGQPLKIYLRSNGVHTDFILPAVHELFDWNKVVEAENYKTPISKNTYISIGWGDHGFYLDTPTWAELKASTALKAAFLPSTTLMHISMEGGVPAAAASSAFADLTINKEQYQALCRYILSSFDMEHQEVQHIPGVGYTDNDNFYKAIGAYHAFNTCNTWVNRGLSEIGVRTAFWSPFDKGIFYQLEKAD